MGYTLKEVNSAFNELVNQGILKRLGDRFINDDIDMKRIVFNVVPSSMSSDMVIKRIVIEELHSQLYSEDFVMKVYYTHSIGSKYQKKVLLYCNLENLYIQGEDRYSVSLQILDWIDKLVYDSEKEFLDHIHNLHYYIEGNVKIFVDLRNQNVRKRSAYFRLLTSENKDKSKTVRGVTVDNYGNSKNYHVVVTDTKITSLNRNPDDIFNAIWDTEFDNTYISSGQLLKSKTVASTVVTGLEGLTEDFIIRRWN